jgi:hypothetical protein
LSERILKMEKEEEEEERSAEDVDLDFLYASIIHAVVGGSEQLTLRVYATASIKFFLKKIIIIIVSERKCTDVHDKKKE